VPLRFEPGSTLQRVCIGSEKPGILLKKATGSEKFWKVLKICPSSLVLALLWENKAVGNLSNSSRNEMYMQMNL